MSTMYFHAEVFDGVTRVQTGPFGEYLRRDEAACLARAVGALANGESGGLGGLLFDCWRFQIPDLEELRVTGLKVHVRSVGGAVARAVGFQRVQISGVPINRLAEVIELCWKYAPLVFGIPAHSSGVEDVPPDLAVASSVQYLQLWRSFGAVFYHGEWVAFSAGHLAQEFLLETIVACFRNGGWECVVSPEPM